MWISLIFLILFGTGLYFFKLNLEKVNFEQISIEKKIKKESIKTNFKNITKRYSDILYSLSEKFSLEWGNNNFSDKEKLDKLKGYWKNSFIDKSDIQVVFYSDNLDHYYISNAHNPFSEESILDKKTISNHNNLSRGTSFFYCGITCQLYIIRPLSIYNFKSGTIQISISIDELMKSINKEVYEADFFALRKSIKSENSIYINDNYYLYESSSNFRKEEEFFQAISNESEKIKISNEDYISKYNDSIKLISVFDYENIIITSMQDITSSLKKSESAFNNLIINSLFFLSIVIATAYLLLSISVKRITWLNEILHLLQAKNFETAKVLLGKRQRQKNYDEIDEIYNSTFNLTKELEHTLLEINHKNKQLTNIVEETRFLAEHDPLTGLFNRRRFNRALEDFIKKNKKFHLISFDLNHFKIINDSLGHSSGDDLLIKTANILNEFITPNGVVGRMGGDEFSAAIFEGDRVQIELLLEKLVSKIKNIAIKNNHSNLHVSTSIGIACFPDDSTILEELSTFSDLAMYENKRFKMNSYNFYDGTETIVQEEKDAQYWREIIEWSLERDYVLSYAQAIVDSKSQSVFSYEILARLKGNHNGNFIDHAEKNRSVIKIDFRILELSLLTGSKIGFPRLNINLSYLTIAQTNCSEIIMRTAMRYHYPPDKIIIEITETIQIDDMKHTKNFMNILKSHGFTFALDDFGSGFSSFSYLVNLGVNYIKIDKSIIVNLLSSNQVSHPILKSIVTLAQEMGIKTIAEGVENTELLEQLNNYEIDYFQGFHFSRPKPMDHLKPLAMPNDLESVVAT
ncbi:MAG: bifunctional diguanylate cyclase/phosphodiesterase [Thiolinea sp.]